MQKQIIASLAVSGLLVGGALALPRLSFADGPWLNLSTYSGSPGSTFIASGGGFLPNESVNVSLAGGPVSGATADQSGSFAGASLSVPQKPAGNYQVLATGDHRDQASANFYITSYYPDANPSQWYLLPGQSLSFSGKGFAPGEQVSVNDSSGTVASSTASASGDFAWGSVVIPFGWQNSTHTYTISGSTSGAQIPLTITIGSFYPQIEPSSYYVQAGSSIAVSGHGFAPNEPVLLTSNGTQVAHTNADGSGNVSFSFIAPNSAGSIVLKASGSLSNQSSSRTVTVHN